MIQLILARMVEVLRLSRPANKSLGASLEASPPAEELGQGGSGEAVRRDRGEEGEHRQALAEVDVWNLLREASVPTRRPRAGRRTWPSGGEDDNKLEAKVFCPECAARDFGDGAS
jgi:hypothetical protein